MTGRMTIEGYVTENGQVRKYNPIAGWCESCLRQYGLGLHWFARGGKCDCRCHRRKR